MRKNRAPKGSVPVVCYNTNTKTYMGMDRDHPLMEEDWIKPIGSLKDYDMTGQPRDKTPVPAHELSDAAPVVVKDVSVGGDIDLGGAEIVEPDEVDEVLEEVVEAPVDEELGYFELKEALTKLGVPHMGNAKKAELQELYNEATK